MLATGTGLSFGLKTVPVNVAYDELVAVWREADALAEIRHMWLWDHMLPLFGDPAAPILEGWSMLATLAAQTERLRLGVLVTSNRFRPPAILAKMAATVDVISHGRLDFGIGVGATDLPGRTGQERAVREYEAYGINLVSAEEGIAALAETCTIVRRLWTESEVTFYGRCYRLTEARCEPKPVQRPHPPILIGGWGRHMLRIVAEHADIWNIPGPPHNTFDVIQQRSKILDEQCAAIGRDPTMITRSTQITVSYNEPAVTCATLQELIDAGFTHLVLGLPTPYPRHVARWAVQQIIRPLLAQSPSSLTRQTPTI